MNYIKLNHECSKLGCDISLKQSTILKTSFSFPLCLNRSFKPCQFCVKETNKHSKWTGGGKNYAYTVELLYC